jgi:hypothetical protein
MQEINEQHLIAQLRSIIDLYLDVCRRFPGDNFFHAPSSEVHKLRTLVRSAVLRIAGPASEYAKELVSIMEKNKHGIHYSVGPMVGVVEALCSDLEAGYLDSLSALLHGEVFADLLDMATHLLEEGYKDPAAVVTGAAIETHLRRLAESRGMSTEIEGRPKKTDLLNAELTKRGVYSRLDQKNITAWLDLRNRAAHGKFDEYSREQVVILLASVRDFMARNPA